MLPLLFVGCAIVPYLGGPGLVTPILPVGPSTYSISGISAGSDSTGNTQAPGGYLVANALGINVSRDQQIRNRREMMDETGNVLIQKATDWCQKRNLSMMPVEAPHIDHNLPPPATASDCNWITFVFKAVPAGQ